MTTLRPLSFLPTLAIASLALLAPTPAPAFTTLSGGRSLVAADNAIAAKDLLKATYKEPALASVIDPTCAGGHSSSLQIVTSDGPLPAVNLPCGNWSAAGSGFKYKSALGGPGGIRTIKYKPGLVKVVVKGPPYSDAPVTGPVDWIETRLGIDTTTYCGRWEAPASLFKKNEADKVRIKGPTVACEEVCGNTIVEGAEQCDDGNLVDGDGCDGNCTLTACGNGVLTAGETCDDGNTASGDGCRADCTAEVCGDGILDAGETCDDGNTVGGDCCGPLCTFESNGSLCASDGNPCTDDVCNGTGTCQHLPNNDPCNDLNGCTVNDTCMAGSCGGEYLQPWVNEFDYDSNDGGVNDDRDEFVEIAGPAGLDLSGYQVVSVEGGGGACGTPFGVNPGDAHFIATIPPGSVLADDTGTGIGFFVVCFTNTSTHVSSCDATLPGVAADSNLKNGNLLNADLTSCPDGILILDDIGGYVDAISYEGLVPNAGAFGGFFHVNAPYSAERDEGWLEQVSIYKNSSALHRAGSASEWTDPSELGALVCAGQIGIGCPTNTDTPGTANPSQSLACGSPCAAFIDPAEGLLD